jgi:hypothetical protein
MARKICKMNVSYPESERERERKRERDTHYPYQAVKYYPEQGIIVLVEHLFISALYNQ